MFEDECDVHLLPYVGNAWGTVQKRIAAPGINRKQYCFGALLWNVGRALFRLASRKTSAHFLAFCKQVHRSVKKSDPSLKIIFVLDNYGIHKTKAVHDWLALHEGEISVLWLPTYAPQLNPVEKIWWFFKRRFLRNRVFADLDDMKTNVRCILRYLTRHTGLIQSLTGIEKVGFGVLIKRPLDSSRRIVA